MHRVSRVDHYVLLGTYIIDPSLKYPSSPQDRSSSSRWERGGGRRRRSRGDRDRGSHHHHWHSRSSGKDSDNGDDGDINAFFQQKHGGGCDLNIGVACSDGVSRRARVYVDSRSDLRVNLVRFFFFFSF
jgi:hypothetical protein